MEHRLARHSIEFQVIQIFELLGKVGLLKFHKASSYIVFVDVMMAVTAEVWLSFSKYVHNAAEWFSRSAC
jgi:hypothetical protein